MKNHVCAFLHHRVRRPKTRKRCYMECNLAPDVFTRTFFYVSCCYLHLWRIIAGQRKYGLVTGLATSNYAYLRSSLLYFFSLEDQRKALSSNRTQRISYTHH